MDTVFINDLEVYAHHGVTDEEQAIGRMYRFDVAIRLDVSTAGASENLADTFDYGCLANMIFDKAKNETHRLLECLAEKVCAEILASSDKVTSVTLKVTKLEPPGCHGAKMAGVEITRKK